MNGRTLHLSAVLADYREAVEGVRPLIALHRRVLEECQIDGPTYQRWFEEARLEVLTQQALTER